MRAAILGANSYIARNLIRVNQNERYAEATLYDCQPEHRDQVPDYHQFNPAEREDLRHAVNGCDLIYFFIGKTGTLRGFAEADAYLDVNEKLLLRLLDVCREDNSRAKILFPSTRLVYRGSETPLDEKAPKEFLTPYAIQKYAAEAYLEMYHRLYGIRYCILRIGVPYGTLVWPVSSYGTVDSFLRQAVEKGQITLYGDGSQRRTFTYIGDLCRMLWQAGTCTECTDDVYNVAGESLSIREIAEQIASLTGASIAGVPWPETAWLTESGSTEFNSEKLTCVLHCQLTKTVEQWVAENQKENGDMSENGNSWRITGGGNPCYLFLPGEPLLCHLRRLS